MAVPEKLDGVKATKLNIRKCFKYNKSKHSSTI